MFLRHRICVSALVYDDNYNSMVFPKLYVNLDQMYQEAVWSSNDAVQQPFFCRKL